MIAPGLRIGRYEIGERLGRGGFGVVHLARDVDLERDIAIKVLKPEYLTRPQVVQRFIMEARAAAKIGHPGIVTVFECGQITGTGTRADGNAYIAMELLRGQSLSDRLADRNRLPAAALEQFEQSYVCQANADTALRAFISACNLKRVAPARKWYGRLSESMRNQTTVICIRNGIPETELRTACDADELKERAQTAFSSGNYGPALKHFEESYACRANADTAMRALIAACNLKRLAPAKKWYGQMSPSMQNQTKVLCIRNGIKEEDLAP
jgi:hypothetical protein